MGFPGNSIDDVVLEPEDNAEEEEEEEGEEDEDEEEENSSNSNDGMNLENTMITMTILAIKPNVFHFR